MPSEQSISQVRFADEPTGNLDTHTTAEVMNLMVKLCRKHNLTLVLVTHDLEISEYADRIVHIIDGEITSIEKRVSKYDLENQEGNKDNEK